MEDYVILLFMLHIQYFNCEGPVLSTLSLYCILESQVVKWLRFWATDQKAASLIPGTANLP